MSDIYPEATSFKVKDFVSHTRAVCVLCGELCSAYAPLPGKQLSSLNTVKFSFLTHSIGTTTDPIPGEEKPHLWQSTLSAANENTQRGEHVRTERRAWQGS